MNARGTDIIWGKMSLVNIFFGQKYKNEKGMSHDRLRARERANDHGLME